MAELEDIIPRRDYKLKPALRKLCTKCGGFLNLLSHDGTTSQHCSSCRTIYPIKRICTFCEKTFSFDEGDCDVCDLEIEALADAEVGIERNEKTIRKITRKYKHGEISEIDFQTQKELSNEEIELCIKDAKKIKERRGTGIPSGSQTQKQ